MSVIKKSILILAILLAPFSVAELFVTAAKASTPLEPPDCTQKTLDCTVVNSTAGFASFLTQFPSPTIADPSNPYFASPTLNTHHPITRTITYMTATNGAITADYDNFKALVQDTYDNPNGWSRLGVKFVRVETGGQFTVVLSQAEKVPTYASICDSTYSCTAGNYVVINQDRWQGATDPWNQAGGDLRNYRNMVVNHETGHWLGHGHQQCGGAGQAAPVMQQQSISLQGCKFNPWPLDSEIWSTTLGI